MNITIKTSHYELTDEIRDYAEKRITGVAEKFIDEDRESVVCELEFARESKHQSGPIYYAELNLEVDGQVFRATAQEETMQASIDKVKDEISKELRRDKRKRLHSVKRGGQKAKEMMLNNNI